jgi:hypothetical protein
MPYDFTKKQHILASYEKEPTIDISIQVLRKQTLHRVLEYEVSWNYPRQWIEFLLIPFSNPPCLHTELIPTAKNTNQFPAIT